jgi:hypothetical protein
LEVIFATGIIHVSVAWVIDIIYCGIREPLLRMDTVSFMFLFFFKSFWLGFCEFCAVHVRILDE